MKNKQVKQMICDKWEYVAQSGVSGVYGYHFGHYLIPPAYVNQTEYALCFDGNEMLCGIASLTADQLKGVKS